MLSIGRLVPGAGEYYIETVARGLEDYYTGAGEAPGYWTGQGAKAIGMEGAVDADHLRALLNQCHPVTGEALIDSAHPVTTAGYDLTFSPPKSVSLLYGLTDEATATAVRDSHDRAVAAALAYIEAHALTARRGAGGARLVKTEGLVAAAFRHRASRNGDPQLHTHVLAANVVTGTDGRHSAPWGALFYYHARAAGYTYQAVLRNELARALGVTFTPVVGGAAEVAGVDAALIAAFSTRRAEIEARLANLGMDSPKAARIATVETRPPKDRVPGKGGLALEALTDTWRARAIQHGHDPDALGSLTGPPRYLDLSDGIVYDVVDELLGPKGLTATVSTFERRDVVRLAAERFPDGCDHHVIDFVADSVMASEQTVALGRLGPGAEERCTTVEILSVEDRLVDRALAGRGTGAARVDEEKARRVIDSHPSLSHEQRTMVERLTTSGDAVQVVVGAAGAGKTFALGLAREIWESSGKRVTGAALAARAAAGLSEGAGISSTTLAALERQLATGERSFSERDVILVDEAAMVGTRMLDHVVTTVCDSGASVVLVGDHKQLPEIETGGAFASLARHVDAIHLTDNRRQVHPWERDALGELRAGSVEQSITALETHGRIHEHDSAADARSALVSDWLESVTAEPHGTTRIYALRRADVEALNGQARAALRRVHKLGDYIYTSGSGRGFARGEEVVCVRNDAFLGVMNGTSGRVLSAQAGVLTVSTPRGIVHIDEPYIAAGHLTYNYASTITKSQGATVDRAFVLGTGSLYREAGYVALSRARNESHLYVVSGGIDQDLSFDELHGPYRPEEPRYLVATLSMSRAKTMARDELTASAKLSSRAPSFSAAPARLSSPAPASSPASATPAAPESYRPVTTQPAQRTTPPTLALLQASSSNLDAPPAHIRAALGDRPSTPRQREAWETAARAIQYYRARSGFSGETAIGPVPEGSVAQMAYKDALRHIADFKRDRAIEGEQERRRRERSRTRSRDVGISP